MRKSTVDEDKKEQDAAADTNAQETVKDSKVESEEVEEIETVEVPDNKEMPEENEIYREDDFPEEIDSPGDSESTDAFGEEDKVSPGDKVKDFEEQNLRIRAEFANYKKRVEREQADFANYIKGEIFKKILPVLDDFKMMLEKTSNGENEQSVLEGARLIYDKFQQILEKEGLEKLEAVGKIFDPEIHEALMMRPIENKEEHDKVIEVFQEGFKLNDWLLRPSKVIVGQYENNTN